MFFCDDKFSTRRTAVCVLRGLMHQLVLQHAHLISCVTGSWKVQKESLFGDNSFDVLWRIFVEMLDRLHGREIYLVLDGLDECEETSLVALLSKLTALVSSGELNGTRYRLKCILLSRDNPPCLPKFLSDFPRLRVDQTDHGDLTLFISEKVSQLATTKAIKDTPLHHQIEASFASTCHGSFLWVIFMAADLSTRSVDYISERLHHLPSQSLEEVRSEIMLRNKDKKDSLFIGLTLFWLEVATRPLSVPEICDAVETIDVMPVREEVSREEIGLNLIRSLGLIFQTSPAFSIIDESGSFTTEERVTFFHQATKDPNIDHQRPSSSDHRSATRSLLEYMSKVPRDTWLYWDDSADESGQEEYPLLNYAIHNWHHHARHLSEYDLQRLMKRNIPYYHHRCLRTTKSQSLMTWARRRYFAPPLFLAKNSTVRDHWFQASRWGSSFEQGDCPMLHVACMLGLENLVRILLRKGNSMFRFWRRARVDVSAGTGEETPLHFAVREKHEGVVSLLLGHGADPCLEHIDGLTPIHYALERSWAIFDILSRLEKANKFISNPGSIRSLLGPPHLHASSLLHFAARAGQEDICRALIERFHYSPNQLDPNTESSILEMAIEGGHLKLARTLVEEWHIKINSPARLLSAVSKARLGENELVQLLELLTSTSDIDLSTQDEEGNTLLHRALDPDISIKAFSLISLHPPLSSARNTHGRTILDAHEVLEPIFILTLLFALQHNLDVNNQDNHGQTSLHHLVTCLSGYISDVFPDYVRYGRVLLDLGACRDVKDGEGRTPADLAREILKRPTRAPFHLGERGLEVLEKYEMARLLQEDSPKSVFDSLEACDDETWGAYPVVRQATAAAQGIPGAAGHLQHRSHQPLDHANDITRLFQPRPRSVRTMGAGPAVGTDMAIRSNLEIPQRILSKGHTQQG